MAHLPKKNQLTDLSPLKAPEIPLPPISDISVMRLIDDALLILYREVKNLMMKSVSGKLEANDARDLRDYVKLLFELKDRESESLRGLTDAQLKAQVAEAMIDDQKRKE